MFNPADEISSINFGSIIGGALNAVVNAQRESADTTVNFVRRVGFKPGNIDSQTGQEVGIGDPICVSFTYDKEVSPSQTQTSRKVTVNVISGGSGYSSDNPIQLLVDDHEIEGATCQVNGGKIESVTLTTVPSEDYIKDGAKVVTLQKNGNEENTSAILTLCVKDVETTVPAEYQKMQIDVPILTMMPIPFIKIENADLEFNVKINSVSNSSSYDKSGSDIKNNTNVGYKGWGFHASTSLNASFSNQKSTSSKEEVKKDYSLNIKVHAVQDDMPSGMSRILDILEESIVTKTLPSKNEGQSDDNADENNP